MHIPETGNTPSLTPATVAPQSGNPPLSPAPSSVSLTPPAPLLSDRLASLLAETGLELSPAQFEDLAVELASLGFSPAELDREGAVRAVFLRRNSVPLTAALLNAPVSPESTALFRQAATLLEEALAVLGSRSVSSEARASVETLARDLETLLGGNAALYGWLGEASRDKRGESAAAAPPPLESLWGIDPGTEGPGDILRKNGMGFEWKLLAWHRAGHDPGMLHHLLHEDLKGILFHFLRDREPLPGRDPLTLKLEDRARSLLDGITARQVDYLLDGSGEQRSLPLAVPADDSRERMYAGIRPDARKTRDESASGPGFFSLAVDVETSRLGMVRARLRFSGKMTSATFLLRDRRALALAAGMADEFRGMLRERGYEPGVIRFALAGRETAYPAENPDRRNSLDIQG